MGGTGPSRENDEVTLDRVWGPRYSDLVVFTGWNCISMSSPDPCQMRQRASAHTATQPLWLLQLEYITVFHLAKQPLKHTHPRRVELVRLCLDTTKTVELACLVLELGFVGLYSDLVSALHESIIDMPHSARQQLETCYLSVVSKASNDHFMVEHDRRGRGNSSEDRIEEIGRWYPTLRWTSTESRQCVICCEALADAVRRTCQTCVYHQHCIDRWLIANRQCPVCRRRLIHET